MPVAIPVLEKDAVELVVHPTVRRAEEDRHLPGRVRVNIEFVDTAGLNRHLAVAWVYLAVLAIDLDAHNTGLDPEVLGLELVEVEEGALGSLGRVDQPPEVVWDGPIQVVLVGLAEEKAAAGWWLEEFGSEEAAEPAMLLGTPRYVLSRWTVRLQDVLDDF